MKSHAIGRLKAKLPKYPDILGKENFFNSAVLIPFILQGGECHLLFQKRANDIRQGGEVCFPGGRYDPQHDKDYEETAIRETIEELGIPREKISLLGRLDTFVAPHGVTIDPFVGILHVDNPDDCSIATNEVERVFTVPMSYFEQNPPDEYRLRVEVQPSYVDEHGVEHILLPAKELGLPERYATPWEGRQYQVFVYKTSEEIIWGITAKLIYDLVQRVTL